MTASITIRHNFETGHRLPILAGKCQNLHGHSWWCEVTASTSSAAADTVVEFGQFKTGLRRWIDTHLDHGLMLGQDDPLSKILPAHGKVHVFGQADYTDDLPWPTVENVAVMLGRVAGGVLDNIEDDSGDVYVSRVRVTETHVNAAEWAP